MVHVLHRPILLDSLPFQMSGSLSLILPSGDFPGEGVVVPLRDDIHGKYLINLNNTSFYSELNLVHVGECFVSIQLTVFKTWTIKLKYYRSPENLTFDLS